MTGYQRGAASGGGRLLSSTAAHPAVRVFNTHRYGTRLMFFDPEAAAGRIEMLD